MSNDLNGFVCAEIPANDCPPTGLCDISCETVCSLFELLPTGTAWRATNGVYQDPSICEPFEMCDPCEPVFVRNFVRLLALQHDKTRRNAAWIIAQLNPLTAPDRSYWLRRWGLANFSVDPVRPLLPCPESPSCSKGECFCPKNTDCEIAPELQAAIEYGLIRAHVLTNRPDFAPSLGNINRALAYLGYMVSRVNIPPPPKPCAESFMAYNVDADCGPLPFLAFDEADGKTCTKNWDVFIKQCPQSGRAVSECEDCGKYRWKLMLHPVADTLPCAPGNPCAPPDPCLTSEEDRALVCSPIESNHPCVPVTCSNPYTCNDLGIVHSRRPAAPYALELLKRIWPIYQPYEVVQINQC